MTERNRTGTNLVYEAGPEEPGTPRRQSAELNHKMHEHIHAASGFRVVGMEAQKSAQLAHNDAVFDGSFMRGRPMQQYDEIRVFSVDGSLKSAVLIQRYL